MNDMTKEAPAMASSVKPTDKPAGGRIQSIDAARGGAMLFVLLGHFGWIYLKDRAPDQEVWTATIGMVASPTFMAISGMMLGFLYGRSRERFAGVQRTLIDRGLFLLTIGHVIIVFAHIAVSGSLGVAFTWGFITDAIGLSIALGPLLITRLSPAVRAGLALGLYAVSWWAAAAWWPDNGALGFLREGLFGSLGKSEHFFYNFPIVPWFCLYLLSSLLGERLAVHYGQGDRRAMARTVFKTAAACAFLAALLVAYRVGADRGWLPADDLIKALTGPRQKLPPSPAYFLGYAAVGLGMMWALLEAEQRGWLRRTLGVLASLGQSSLFVFVLQYYVYFTVVHLLPLPYTPFWPAILAVSALVITLLARLWLSRGYNRFITVGYGDARPARRALFAISLAVLVLGLAAALIAKAPDNGRAAAAPLTFGPYAGIEMETAGSYFRWPI